MIVTTYSQDAYDKYLQNDKSPTIKASGGVYGGGSETLVIQEEIYCLQGNGIDRSDNTGCAGKGFTEDKCYTLNTVDRHVVAYSFDSLSSNSMKSKNQNSGCHITDVAKTLDTTIPEPSKNQGGICIMEQNNRRVFDARGNGDGSVVPTLTGDHENRITDYTAITFDDSAAVDCRNATENIKINGTLQAKSTGGQSLNLNNVVRKCMTVRRLTPLECERLQGFDDNWTNIPPQAEITDKDFDFWRKVWSVWSKINSTKLKSDNAIRKWLNSPPVDSARYKMLGNSIALPSWRFVLSRISKQYDRPATMASLFDGIGGFPKIWEEINGTESCIWASEVDPEPIRVTNYRFNND